MIIMMMISIAGSSIRSRTGCRSDALAFDRKLPFILHHVFDIYVSRLGNTSHKKTVFLMRGVPLPGHHHSRHDPVNFSIGGLTHQPLKVKWMPIAHWWDMYIIQAPRICGSAIEALGADQGPWEPNNLGFWEPNNLCSWESSKKVCPFFVARC